MAQKTILQITQAVCGELNFPQPATVISSQDQNVLKLLEFARAINDDLLYEFDWQVLQNTYTFSTTNGVATYPFPTDYCRSIDGTFFDTSNRWPLRGSLTPTQWAIINTFNVSTSPFERMRVMGGKLDLFPTPGATTINFRFDYISSNYVIDGGTQLPKADYTQDSDICIFDARLVEYGIKWKFLSGIGQDASAAQAEYMKALSLAKGRDLPSQRISLIPPQERLLSNSNFADSNFG